MGAIVGGAGTINDADGVSKKEFTNESDGADETGAVKGVVEEEGGSCGAGVKVGTAFGVFVVDWGNKSWAGVWMRLKRLPLV